MARAPRGPRLPYGTSWGQNTVHWKNRWKHNIHKTTITALCVCQSHETTLNKLSGKSNHLCKITLSADDHMILISGLFGGYIVVILYHYHLFRFFLMFITVLLCILVSGWSKASVCAESRSQIRVNEWKWSVSCSEGTHYYTNNTFTLNGPHSWNRSTTDFCENHSELLLLCLSMQCRNVYKNESDWFP